MVRLDEGSRKDPMELFEGIALLLQDGTVIDDNQQQSCVTFPATFDVTYQPIA